MRKIISTLTAVALLLGMSCSKKETENRVNSKAEIAMSTTTNAVRVDARGFLKFEDEEQYEETLHQLSRMSNEELEQWESNIGFSSSYSYYNIANYDEDSLPKIIGFNNSTFVDPLLVRIIDKNGMIQIGNYVFALFIDNGYILETNVANLDQSLNDLKNGIYIPNIMNKFSGDWDNGLDGQYESVFDFLATGTVGFSSEGALVYI